MIRYIKVARPTDTLIASGSQVHIDSQNPPIPAADVLSVSIIILDPYGLRGLPLPFLPIALVFIILPLASLTLLAPFVFVGTNFRTAGDPDAPLLLLLLLLFSSFLGMMPPFFVLFFV
jgi:hypothetical protein